MAVAVLYLGKVMPLLFIMSLFLGYLYNFPPARLKDSAWGGTVANFVGHGVITFLVGWLASRMGAYAGAEFNRAVIAALSAGFANAAVYITTTIPDAEGDRKTGKKTFCVTYGERATAITATVFCIFAFAAAFTMEFNKWLMILPSAASTVLFLVLAVFPGRENAFKAFKWPVFLLTAGVAVFVPVYVVLILLTFFGSRIYYKLRFNFEYPTFKSF
jgi:4-hydroxybenzoate polyprenyltransferase